MTSPLELAIVKIALLLKPRRWKQGLPAFHRSRCDGFSERSKRLSRNLPGKDRPNAGPSNPIGTGNFRENPPVASVLFPSFCKAAIRQMIGGNLARPYDAAAAHDADAQVYSLMSQPVGRNAITVLPLKFVIRNPSRITSLSVAYSPLATFDFTSPAISVGSMMLNRWVGSQTRVTKRSPVGSCGPSRIEPHAGPSTRSRR